MSKKSLAARLLTRLFSRRRPYTVRRPARFPGGVEQLEDRTVPGSHTWIGDGNISSGPNWQNAYVPTIDPNSVLLFPTSASGRSVNNNLSLSDPFRIDSMQVDSILYFFTAQGTLYQFNPGAALTTTNTSGQVTFGPSGSIGVSDSLVIQVATGGTLALQGPITNPAGSFITKMGGGTLWIDNNYGTWEGAFSLSGGKLLVGRNDALGTGPLQITGGTVGSSASVTLSNPVTLGAGVVTIEATNPLTFSGPTTVLANRTITVPAGGSATPTFSGVVSGSGRLTKNGAGALALTGNNTFSGGLILSEGRLLLGPTNSAGSGTLTLNGGTLAASSYGTITLGNAVSLGGAVDFDDAFTLTGATSLAANSTLTTYGTATFSGPVGGTGQLTKTGPARLTLSGANTYSGGTVLSDGILVLGSNSALGTGPLTINGGALQSSSSGVSVPNAVVTGTGINFGTFSPSLTLSGPVSLTADSVFDAASSFGPLTLSGAISGGWGWTKTGTGTLALSGGADNAFTRPVVVSAGSLVLAKTNGAVAIPAGLTINGGSVRLAGSDQIADSAVLTLNAGSLDLAGFSDTVGGLVLGGGSISMGAGVLSLAGDVTAAAGSATIAGAVQLLGGTRTMTVGSGASVNLTAAVGGAAGLVKAGAGTLTLAADNTYTGAMAVTAGTLVVNGSQPGSPVQLSGGTLQGRGTIGTLAATGGVVQPGTGVGSLRVSGGATFGAAATLAVELAGDTPGTGYDQLDVTGAVELGGATLTLSRTFTPTLGDRFVIVANDGTDAVVGTFADLADGSTVTQDGVTYRVDYAGGDGNDVTLTVVPTPGTRCQPPSPSPLWPAGHSRPARPPCGCSSARRSRAAVRPRTTPCSAPARTARSRRRP